MLGIIHRIFQGEVKVEQQSVIVKENADEKDRLLFDVDRGKITIRSNVLCYYVNIFDTLLSLNRNFGQDITILIFDIGFTCTSPV